MATSSDQSAWVLYQYKPGYFSALSRHLESGVGPGNEVARVCWPVRPWLFKFFSMPPTRLTLNNRSANLLPATSTSALPFSEVLVAVFQQLLRAPRFRFRTRLKSLWPMLFISPAQLSLLRFVQRTSLPVFQCGSSPVSSVVFQRCFQL